MTPRLVRDCVFAAGEELVRVRSNRGAFVLNGKHVANWLSQLAPYLDGRRSLEVLTAALPAAARADVEKLISMLVEQNVVQDLDLELPHGLTKDELAAAASEIAYIDSCVSSGAYYFERFRDSSVLVQGAAPIAAAIADRVRTLGCLRVEVAGPDADSSELAPSQPGLVLTCSADPTRLMATNRACRISGTVLLPIAMAGEVVWIGPLVTPSEPGCWECAWRRLADRQGSGDGAWRADPISTALLANRAAFEVFAVLTGTSRAGITDGLVQLQLDTGLSERHPFHPHPLCEACGGDVTREQVAWWERWLVTDISTQIRTEDAVSSTADDLVDSNCGILRSLSEEDLPQLPFRAIQAVVSNPAPSGDPIIVVATAETLAESRTRVVQRALASYAQALCEHRLAVSNEWVNGLAWDLVGGAPARIQRGTSKLISAAGNSWAAALAAALFEHSVRLLDADDERLGDVPEISLEAASLADPYIAWTGRLAAVIGLSPTLFDLTGEFGVPAVAVAINGVRVAHTAAAGRDRAAALAMEAMISRWQVGGNEPVGRFEMGDMPKDDRWRALAGYLLNRGWRPLVMPLYEDRAVSSICPHVITVALVPSPGRAA